MARAKAQDPRSSVQGGTTIDKTSGDSSVIAWVREARAARRPTLLTAGAGTVLDQVTTCTRRVSTASVGYLILSQWQRLRESKRRMLVSGKLRLKQTDEDQATICLPAIARLQYLQRELVAVFNPAHDEWWPSSLKDGRDDSCTERRSQSECNGMGSLGACRSDLFASNSHAADFALDAGCMSR